MSRILIAISCVVIWLAALPGNNGSVLASQDGAAGAKDALDRALDEQRRAISFYDAVLSAHGAIEPFSVILEEERSLAGAMASQYKRLGLDMPLDRWAEHEFRVPGTLAESCDRAIVGETRAIREFDELLGTIGDDELAGVLDRARSASAERHLPSFQQHSSGWKLVGDTALTGAQTKQKDLASTAQQSLTNSLLKELMGAIMDGGPGSAIGVCSERAPALAEEVGSAAGVRIGRTSFKIRNPSNHAPAWAELEMESRPETARYFSDSSGRLGALLPIKTTSFCLRCHGPREQLAAEVTDALSARYPDDEATGFRSGDLRGWFWVEVPVASGGE